MALKHTKQAGNNPSCPHKWVARSKRNISILERVCTDCGQVEYHSESNLDEATIKKIMQ